MTPTQQFLRWMKSLEDRSGSRTGTLSIWIQTDEETLSYTLLFSKEGVALREPGLREADLVLSCKEAYLSAWLEGTLEPEKLPKGAFAWDGDVRLLKELGARMANEPLSPHRSLIKLHTEG